MAEMTARDAAAYLATKRRTLLLGGMAVILHGLSRGTKDIDIWMDPLPDVRAWGRSLRDLLTENPELRALSLTAQGVWMPIPTAELFETAERDGMIRLACADRPVDLFYLPNELDAADFSDVWSRAAEMKDGLRLMEEIDLIVTKQLTGRATDEIDIRFLSDKIEGAYRRRLPQCVYAEAKLLLDRYATPEICAFACQSSPDPKVRKLARGLLEDMANQDDPFAREWLEKFGRRRRRARHNKRVRNNE